MNRWTSDARNTSCPSPTSRRASTVHPASFSHLKVLVSRSQRSSRRALESTLDSEPFRAYLLSAHEREGRKPVTDHEEVFLTQREAPPRPAA